MQAVHDSLKNALVTSVLFALVVGPLVGLITLLIGHLNFNLFLDLFGVLLITLNPLPNVFFVGLIFGGVFAGLFGALFGGGLFTIEHYLLRLILWRNHMAPLDYASFLTFCSDRLLLRQESGGYSAHGLLLEYFASLREVEEVPDVSNGK